LPDTAKLTAEWRPSLLKGVTVIKSRAVSLQDKGAGKVEKTEQEFTAIPYYAWANRQATAMQVWNLLRQT